MADLTGLLGYNPAGSASAAGGFQSKEQWIAYVSTALANQYYNGTAGKNGEFYWSNDFWAANGLGGPLDPSEYGMGAGGHASGMVDLRVMQLAQRLYDMGGAPGLPSTAGLKDLGATYSDAEKDRIANATMNSANNATQLSIAQGNNATQMAIANLQEAGATARQAQELASRMSIAQLQEAGESARNAARILSQEKIAGIQDATNRYGIDVNAAVSREDIAARERMSAADRTSRETIAQKALDEQTREFDLRLGEDRRQFNVSSMMTLLTQGVELSRRPVDWLAHQYWLSNMGMVVNQLNLMASAQQLGAIPPSGPSELGPMTGGPAAVDGDTSLDPQARVVSLQEAVQANPGDAGQYENLRDIATTMSAAPTYEQLKQTVGDPDRILDEARAQAIPATSENPQAPSVQGWMQEITQKLQMAPVAPAELGPGQTAQNDQWQQPPTAAPAPPPIWGQPLPYGSDQVQNGVPVPPTSAPPPGQPALQAPPEVPPTTLNAGLSTVDAGGGVPVPPPAPPPPPPVLPGTPPTNAQEGNTGGIYTGPGQAQATASGAVPPSTTQPGATPMSTDGGYAQLINQIAAALGMTPAQVQQMFPNGVLPQQYGDSVIQNSPILRALREGWQGMSAYNTGPTGGRDFTQTPGAATGGIGVRGGQDINAGMFLRAVPSQREQMQGAVEATGQYWPDVLEQMQRSSPISDVPVGVAGRRRYF